MIAAELFGYPLFDQRNPDILSAGSGFIAAAKPVSRSSFWVVKRFRHHFGLKKIGHAGTLDPAASGLMILAFGKATRSIEQVQELEKTYIATIRFGATTPSLDADSAISGTAEWMHIDLEAISRCLEKEFSGEILQVPPMFSALKVDGTRLYKLARKGEEIPRAPRPVTIFETRILDCRLPGLSLLIRCSKGTYVRTLASDLGTKLGSLAYLTGLSRTAIGPVTLENALETPLFVPKP